MSNRFIMINSVATRAIAIHAIAVNHLIVIDHAIAIAMIEAG